MSRNGKKGFKRLNTHELVELNRNGRDSGSESELLDLTTITDEHDPRRSYCGCCFWFGVLYIGLLTILVFLVGAFSGYVFITSLQTYEDFNTTTNDIQETISKLRKDLETHSTNTYHVLNGLRETTFLINTSLSAMSAAMNETMMHMTEEVKELDHRLTIIESNPQEVLIKQVDTIHTEMAVLDRNMDKMNHSLNELHEMREKMASLGSTLSSYESKFQSLSSDIGDVVHDNTDLQDVVQGFMDKIQNFSHHLDDMDTNLTLEHNRMNQSMNYTSVQFSDLRTLMISLNDSMSGEMVEMSEEMAEIAEIKSNITKVESILGDMSVHMSGMHTNLSSLSQSIHNLTMDIELVNSTVSSILSSTPPPTPPPTPPTPPTPSSSPSETATIESHSSEVDTDNDASLLSDDPSHSMPGGGGGGGGGDDAASEDDAMLNDDPSPSVPGGDVATSKPQPMGKPTTPSQPTGGSDSTKATEDIPRTETDLNDGSDGDGGDGDGDSDGGTPSNAPQMLQKLLDNFDRLDRNKDNSLDANEFSSFGSGFGDNRRIFILLDMDKSGKIERSELETTLLLISDDSGKDLKNG